MLSKQRCNSDDKDDLREMEEERGGGGVRRCWLPSRQAYSRLVPGFALADGRDPKATSAPPRVGLVGKRANGPPALAPL